MQNELDDALSKDDDSTRGSKVADLFSGKLSGHISSVPTNVWLMSEQELEKEFQPSNVDFLIRERMTRIVKEARDSGEKLETKSAYDGICKAQNFYNTMQNPYRVVWWLTELEGDEELLRIGFFKSTKLLMEALRSIKPNEKNLKDLLKAAEFFSNRHLGTPTQRIDQRTLNYNLNSSSRDAVPLDEVTDPKQLEQMYREKMLQLQPRKIKDIDVE